MYVGRAYSSSKVCSNVVARGGHDQTEGRKGYHQGEANPTIKHIEDLGKRHVGSCAHDRRNDANQRQQGVRLELACDVRTQAAGDGLLEVVDEVQEEHPSEALADCRVISY